MEDVTLSFFTENPQPYGAEGYPGGMLNGLVGTTILIGLSGMVGVPVGMLTGIYLSEYGANSYLAIAGAICGGCSGGGAEHCGGDLGI